MSADWRELCRAGGLRFQGDVISVECSNGRAQQVRVDDSEPGVFRLWSKVANRSQLADRAELQHPEIEAWLVNRYRELVGFKITNRGSIIGEAWVPDIELTAEEWTVYVVTVAQACDRLEFLWTGADRD